MSLAVKGSNALAATVDFYAAALAETTAALQQTQGMLKQVLAQNEALKAEVQSRDARPAEPPTA
jgi:hypothetical protein